MISYYTKLPVVIKAVKWTGDNLKEVTTFIESEPRTNCAKAQDMWELYEKMVKAEGLKIRTLEGTMNADIGDWIIRGVNGEFYPCKPDIFDKTYRVALASEIIESTAP